MNFIKQKLAFPAFQSRNYQLYFTGQGLSLIGTWMTQTATVWLVYHLTQSAVWLGIIGFVSQIPNFVLVPFGGVLVDRWNHHQTLLVTQMLSMLQSFALAILALTGTINIWWLIGLGLLQGVINSIDAPTRQSFVLEIVEHKDDLASAIALNSSMVTGARILGPAIGGIVVAAVGAGYCFLIDGCSYLAVLVVLRLMQLQPKLLNPAHSPIKLILLWQNLQEGLIYTFGDPVIRLILLMVALVSFLGINYAVILPIFVTEVLHGNAHTLGTLMAASGIGALSAAVSLSLRRSIRGLGRLIAVALLIVGGSMIALGFSHTLWLSTLLLVGIGFGSLLQTASSNTIIQTLVQDDKRGRVMSIYIMAFLGVAPFGNLVKGYLIGLIGVPTVVILNGSICLIGAIFFAKNLPKLRQTARRMHPEFLSHDGQEQFDR